MTTAAPEGAFPAERVPVGLLLGNGGHSKLDDLKLLRQLEVGVVVLVQLAVEQHLHRCPDGALVHGGMEQVGEKMSSTP